MAEKLRGGGLITPIVKRGKGEVGDYRGITLMPTLYKVNALVLARRLMEEVEGKKVVPYNQTGLGREWAHWITTCMYLIMVNGQLGQKGGRMIAVFVDLKAAFDMVNRILIESMKKRGIIREG